MTEQPTTTIDRCLNSAWIPRGLSPAMAAVVAVQVERAVAAQLVGYIQGHGPHPEAFLVQEGSGT